MQKLRTTFTPAWIVSDFYKEGRIRTEHECLKAPNRGEDRAWIVVLQGIPGATATPPNQLLQLRSPGMARRTG